ncbi:MAG: tetratricopeptide repeat protein [Methanothrix sp.]
MESTVGVIELNKKNISGAKEKFNRSLDIRRKFGKESRLSHCLYHLAIINDELGNNEEAEKLLKEALEICLRIGDPHIESFIYYEIATRSLRLGDLTLSSSNLLKALKILQQIGDIAGEAAVWHQLAVLMKKQGKMNECLKFLAVSHYLNDKIGHEKKEHSKRSLLKVASQLGYSQERLDEVIQDGANSYQRDKGRHLLETQFN